MDQPLEQSDGTPRHPSSVLSDISFGSNSTAVASPTSPTFQRPAFPRVPSVVEEDPLLPAKSHRKSSIKRPDGLGITNLDDEKTIPRRPVGSKASHATMNSIDSLVSPISSDVGKGFDLEGKLQDGGGEAEHLVDSPAPQMYSPNQSVPVYSQAHHGHDETPFACKSKGSLDTGRGSWVAIAILILSIYSTVFSLLWLVIAIARPIYHHTITTAGKITPQVASIVSAAFAKSIELSFVTVTVAILGQILSKRALGDRKSITIAEMSMRSWVLQPGTMLTHPESLRYAAVTRLGILAVLAALLAMVYTTASDALVAPRLRPGKIEHRKLFGQVSTGFANSAVLQKNCPTPIQADDTEKPGETCIELQFSGESYHNYMQYLGFWNENIQSGNLSVDLRQRPSPVGMLNDNTTVTGSWVNITDMAKDSNTHQRIVNEVTMAMPHSGVVAAASDKLNDITQPRDVSGIGEYFINASVPSPAVNVLCAELTQVELQPMVYYNWSSKFRNNTELPTTSTWPAEYNLTLPDPYLHTVVDGLFGFGADQVHPIFPKLPLPYNTVINITKVYGPHSIYILAAAQDSDTSGNYTLCSLRAAVFPDCSTQYHATMSGSYLNARCEDPKDPLSYSKLNPLAPNNSWSPDWPEVATDWALALSLDSGITDGQASNARLLSQMIPTQPSLNPSRPSIAEALAMLAGSTLLMSTLNSPFIHYWNYSTETPVLTIPQYQSFPATFSTFSFQSGPSQSWQNIFYIVLVLVFVINVCCFIYFFSSCCCFSSGLMTDFMEPQNMFCLSLLSPPNEVLAGACGGGPAKEHFAARWNIKIDREREHLWIDSNEASNEAMRNRRRMKSSIQRKMEYEMESTPLGRSYSRIRKDRTSML